MGDTWLIGSGLLSFAPSALLVTVVAVVSAGSPAKAEQSGAFKRSSSIAFDGWRGEHEIRASPNTLGGVGDIHAMQIDIGAEGGTFVAIGTARGLGADGIPAGSPSCPNDYNPRWDIYVDGIVDGIYFCRTEASDVYTTGDSPSFTLRWGDCPNGNRWGFFMGGTKYHCHDAAAHNGSRVIVMLETTPTTNTVDRNIDVMYRDLDYRINGNWTGADNFVTVEAVSYTVTQPGSRRVNVFDGTLD